MRRGAVLIVTIALTGCAGLSGPSRADLTDSYARYTPEQSELKARLPGWQGEPFDDATLLEAGLCEPFGAFFVCEGRFRTKDGVEGRGDLWLTLDNGRWRLRQIVPHEEMP